MCARWGGKEIAGPYKPKYFFPSIFFLGGGGERGFPGNQEPPPPGHAPAGRMHRNPPGLMD